METLLIKIPDDKSLIVKQVLKEFGITSINQELKSNILNLSPEQKVEITSSQEQINNGLFMEQAMLDDEIDLWLRK
ncbi:hypothetical protein ACJVDH_01555 [Pedobacter sp. AW1-32]|uniref:hypothetical protein n=1 Tax=Pedobacter sp. AW1-32 TaxID=3383026 RepID=UPI003FEF04DA